MSSFDFITDEGLRNSLSSDFQELNICYDGRAWKGVHVFAGSIVEALLIELLIAEGFATREVALKMDLSAAASVCKDKKIISERTSDLLTVIRGYRNLIHPGRQVRLNEVIDQNSAEVAKALVNMVSQEIEKRRRENYGYTAEQIVSKLERDSSAEILLSHLLSKTNETETERLLLSVLPTAYQRGLEEEFGPPSLLPSFRTCFRLAFDQAIDVTKRKVIVRFSKMLKEGSEQEILLYENAFLVASDLHYLDVEDAEIVKKHLLARLKSSVDEDLVRTIQGLGQFLMQDEVPSFVDPLIVAMRKYTKQQLSKAIQERIEGEWMATSSPIDALLVKRIEDWIALYREKEIESEVQRLEQIKSNIDSALPF